MITLIRKYPDINATIGNIDWSSDEKSLFMKKLIFILLVSVLPVSVWAIEGDGTSGNPYYGTLNQDMVFSGNVYIGGDIYLDTYNLIINPGARIIFTESGLFLFVASGTLSAEGSSSQEITFTADYDLDGIYAETGEYPGTISVEFTAISTSFNYCNFENSRGDYGAAIDIYGGYGVSILNSDFYGCSYSTALDYSGCISADGSDITVTDCRFYSNSCHGIYIYPSCSISITGCEFYSNTANSILSKGDPQIFNSVFRNNSFLAVDIQEGTATIENSIFYKNITSISNPGGLKTGPSATAQVTNCTFTGNVNNVRTPTIGGGAHISTSGSNFKNCIFWLNRRTSSTDDVSGSPSYTTCALSESGTGQYSLGTNNVSATGPNFKDPNADDYSITVLSPCRDAGTDSGAPYTDFAGNSRIGVTDIGAYENIYTKWTGNLSTNWTESSNWDNGSPGQSMDALIPDVTNDPSVSSTVTTGNISIQPGGLITVNSGHLFTTGNILNAGTFTITPTGQSTVAYMVNTGIINLNSNSTGMFSLIMGNFGGSGTVNSQIYFTGGDAGAGDYRWHYMAVPATMNKSELLTDIATDNLLLYDDSKVVDNKDDGWQWHDGWDGTTGFTDMQQNRGYNFYHSNSSGAIATLTSTTLQYSIASISLQYSGALPGNNLYGWNLVGNSLTSSLDWDLVTKSASTRDAVYYTFENEMVAYVNGFSVGGSRYVPPLQGFFVKTTATGQSINLSNARVHNTSQLYYKKGSTRSVIKTESVEKPHIRLAISDGDQSDETIIRFENDATDLFDGQYDASKWISATLKPKLYSTVLNEDYAINALPFPTSSTVIPLSIKISVDGTYSIRKTDLYGLEQYNIYLKDHQENKTVNLKDISEYNFAAVAGTSSSRFTLTFSDISTGTEDDIIIPGKEFNIYSAHGIINIQTLGDFWDGRTGTVRITDVTGKSSVSLQNVEFSKDAVTEVPSPGKKGIYIVEIVSGPRRYSGKVVIL